MLEVCPTIAAGRPSCEVHPLSIGGREDPVRLVFTAPPGQAVVVCLIDVGGRLRLVANEVDVVAPDEDLPRLPVARAVWVPRPELSTAAEAWLMAGGCGAIWPPDSATLAYLTAWLSSATDANASRSNGSRSAADTDTPADAPAEAGSKR